MKTKKMTIPEMKDFFSEKQTGTIWDWSTKEYVKKDYIDHDNYRDYEQWIHHIYRDLTYYKKVKLMNIHLEEWFDFPLTYIWNKRYHVWFVHASKTYYYNRKNFYMYGLDGYEEFDREFNLYLRGKKIRQLKDKIRQR